jgi:hypothetical protein
MQILLSAIGSSLATLTPPKSSSLSFTDLSVFVRGFLRATTDVVLYTATFRVLLDFLSHLRNSESTLENMAPDIRDHQRTPPASTDDRKRLLRNISIAALVALVLLYYCKFTYGEPYRPMMHMVNSTAIEPKPKSSTSDTEYHFKGPDVKLPPAWVVHHNELFNGTIVDKVAIIIETRARSNLIPLILHFSVVLGPTWPIICFTSDEIAASMQSSAALSRHLAATGGPIQLRILPSTVLFSNSDSVSAFLTKPWLWQQLAPAKWVLMFQSDAMLCANAARSVEDFFEYDFVGAPISVKEGGEGFNGGLSLRKRETILRIIEENDWETNRGKRFEDRWYFDR